MADRVIRIEKKQEGESRLAKITAELTREGIVFEVTDEALFYLINLKGY